MKCGAASGRGIPRTGFRTLEPNGANFPVTLRANPRQPLRADVVRDALRDAIVRGEFSPSSRLPNEDFLCALYEVSRTTIREAVRGLVADGLLIRRQGSGTFVASRPRLQNSLDMNFSYTELIRANGMVAGHRVLGVNTCPADERVATSLGIEEGARVVRVDRVRTADGQPAIYSIAYVATSLVDSDQHAHTFERSIYDLLARLGHVVDYGEATLTPVLADEMVADILQVELFAPLQHLSQVDFDARGHRLMLSDEWHVPRVIEFVVYRRGPGRPRT